MIDSQRSSWSAALLAVAVALTLALPPDVYPETGALAALMLGGALWLGSARVRWGVLLIALAWLALQCASSLAPARTATTVLRVVLPAAALAASAGVGARQRRWILWAAAASGAALGLLAIAQKWLILPASAAWAREAGAAQEILIRLDAGRPFGTHAVPAALAGALTLALAASVALALTRDSRRGALALAIPTAIGLLLTASLGGVIALSVALVLLLIPVWKSLPRPVRAGVLVGAPLLFAALIALRPVPVLDLSRADHPLRLRLGNWRAAVLIAPEQPFVGTGLGSYGALMPHVRRDGDQETLFAHNTWLQLSVEGGLPAALLLLAAAVWLSRRWRWVEAAENRVLLAGVTAFAVHNLLDFTAYLPGVAVAAFALTGLIVTRLDDSLPDPRPTRLLAVLVALCAVPWGLEAAARVQLGSNDGERVAQAAQWAPWSIPIALRAGHELLTHSTAPDDARNEQAAQIGERLTTIDPESPAGWHLLGAARQAQARPGSAWLALEVAASRHRTNDALLASLHAIEAAFTRAGMFSEPLHYGQPAVAKRYAWQGWDDLLLIAALVGTALVTLRRTSASIAPPEALLLSILIVLVPWGEGGALPGVRLARALIIGAAITLTLFPLRGQRHQARDREWPLVPLLLLAPVVLIAALSAAFSPDGAGARDGLMSLLVASMAVVLSWDLARRFVAWPRIVVTLVGAAASLMAALWLLQKLSLLSGLDIASWPVPLGVEHGLRPAADFLHPGHLGTFLVAGGMAWVGHALFASEARAKLLGGLALIACGLAGGARGSVVGLFAGGVLLAIFAASPQLRRYIVAGLAVLTTAGVVAVVVRFSAGDPYMWRRVEIWQASVGAILDRPWFGFGPGGFEAVAAHYRFLDPGPAAHFGRTFSGPHSDALNLFLSFGLIGGALSLSLLLMLGGRALRTARLAHHADPALAGGAAALVVLVAHGLADDLLSERPAAAIVAALLLGALGGGRLERQRLWKPSSGARWAIAVSVLTALLACEVVPWAADRYLRAGDPMRAALSDRRRAGYWIAAARDVEGEALPKLARALDRTRHAVSHHAESGDTWKELALVLDAACRGPLSEKDVCYAALDAWQRAIEAVPRDALARFGRARLADSLGETGIAREELQRAIQDEPNFLAARIALAHLWLRSGDKRAASEESQRIREVASQLDGVHPESDYEGELLRLTPESWRSLQQKLSEP